MSVLTTLGSAASTVGGSALATATKAIAVARPAVKPLHPRGRVIVGKLFRSGLEEPIGVAWLDEAGTDEVLVRVSRAIGLPGRLPDIHGLALRVPVGEEAYGDVLFASTGLGQLSRFVLTASRSPEGRPMTTLLPYRTAGGSVLLGACLVGRHTIELSAALPAHRGEWRRFADLRLSQSDAPDPTISFDPVQNTLPGLEQYSWVRRLREPSYDTARGSRRAQAGGE